jgi:hypothetical protein
MIALTMWNIWQAAKFTSVISLSWLGAGTLYVIIGFFRIASSVDGRIYFRNAYWRVILPLSLTSVFMWSLQEGFGERDWRVALVLSTAFSTLFVILLRSMTADHDRQREAKDLAEWHGQQQEQQ